MSILIHRTDINDESYDLTGVVVDVRLTKLPDGWRVEEIVVPDTDDEVGVHIAELVEGAER